VTQLVLIFEMETSYYNTSGVLQNETLFFSTHNYRPPPGAGPRGGASIEPFFNPIISGSPKTSFRVGTHTWGTSTESGTGVLELINDNGKMEFLLSRQTKGKPSWAYVGDPTKAFSTFTLVAKLTQEKFIMAKSRVVRMSFKDELAALDEPIQKTVFPVTTPNVNLRGQPMPKFYGVNFSVPVAVHDKVNEVYQTSDAAAMNSFIRVMDNGVVLPLGGGAAKYTVTTTADTGKSSITLGSNSFGKITVDAVGPAATNFYLPYIIPWIMEIDCGITMTAPEKALIVAESNNHLNFIGFYADTPITGRDAVQFLLDQANAFLYQNVDGTKSISYLREPRGNPDVFVDDVFNDFLKITDDAPGLTTSLGALKNWHVTPVESLAAAVTDAYKTELPGQHRNTVDATDPVHDNYAHARTAEPLDTTWSTSNDGLMMLDRKTCFYGGMRWFYSMTIEMDQIKAATLKPNQVVALSEKTFNLVDPYDITKHGVPLATSGVFCDHETELVKPLAVSANSYFEILDNRSTIWLKDDNSNRVLKYPYTITPDTLLEFDLLATSAVPVGAIGVGVCRDPYGFDWLRSHFQLYGAVGVTGWWTDYTHNNYILDSGWKRYSISLPAGFKDGAVTLEDCQYLAFTSWPTAPPQVYNPATPAVVKVRNVRLREKGYLNTRLVGAEKELGNSKVKILTWGA